MPASGRDSLPSGRDAPPIQYARTSDGFSVAYTDSGNGMPIIWMPFTWHNLLHMTWRGETRPMFERLSEHCRVILYDSRGQGGSTRGLKPDLTEHDFELDIEALADGLGLERFALYGVDFFGHVALRYAAAHPERVAALILRNVRLNYAADGAFLPMAEHNWDLFVDNRSRIAFRGIPQERAGKLISESVTQADWLVMGKVIAASVLDPAQLNVTAPSLIFATTERAGMVPDAMAIAAAIPNSRLVTFGPGPFVSLADEDAPSMLGNVVSFLKGLPFQTTAPADGSPSHKLSSREIEVLRLIADGRSNAQIAEALVISPNTVGRHVSNIFDKIGAANRAEATAYALRNGIA